ncbi:NAD(P)H-dependent oxidoreductase [Paenibacillus sp. BAC0078]
MKIAVLNGSPKGEESVTVQYVKYLEKRFPQHEFIYIHVAHSLKKLESDLTFFNKAIGSVASSDGVIWAFPLYFCMVHSHYKRFIELIWERGVQDAFKDKYTASVATSLHFHDHIALNYIHSICDDLGMRYIDSFSAHMNDLMQEKVRSNLILFAENVFESIEKRNKTLRTYMPIQYSAVDYIPGEVKRTLENKGQRIVIVTDSVDQTSNIGRMVDRFRKLTQAEVIDISAIEIKGGCKGCIKCGFDNQCIYGKSDDIQKIYEQIREFDIIVYAGGMKDRYLSATWKIFIERSFFRTHQPQFTGRQMGVLISGPLSQNSNLLEHLQALIEFDGANLAGILTDEYGDSAEINERMEALAHKLVQFSAQHYLRPQTFLGIGGMKILRDDIWGNLRFVFQGDHRYFKKHGLYDFPHKKYGTRMVNSIMIPLTKLPPVKKNIRQNINKYMVIPHKNVVKNK